MVRSSEWTLIIPPCNNTIMDYRDCPNDGDGAWPHLALYQGTDDYNHLEGSLAQGPAIAPVLAQYQGPPAPAPTATATPGRSLTARRHCHSHCHKLSSQARRRHDSRDVTLKLQRVDIQPKLKSYLDSRGLTWDELNSMTLQDKRRVWRVVHRRYCAHRKYWGRT